MLLYFLLNDIMFCWIQYINIEFACYLICFANLGMMDVHHILLIDIYINLSVSDLFNNLDNAQMREQHLLLLLSGVLPWIDPPDVISKEIEEGRSGR